MYMDTLCVQNNLSGKFQVYCVTEVLWPGLFLLANKQGALLPLTPIFEAAAEGSLLISVAFAILMIKVVG